MKFLKLIIFFASLLGLSANAYDANTDDLLELSLEELFLVEISLLGKKNDIQKVAGSAYVIDEAMLEKFHFSDIQRILQDAPGISIQLEDAYGLRPNIGMRGVATERSSRITLLEDNILIAPAPYSAPAAYYFPSTGRFQGIEIIKGPTAITHGPYTIGGTMNILSTSIPSSLEGKLLLEAGEKTSNRLHANIGGFSKNGIGFLVETYQQKSDGFQSIQHSSEHAGFDLKDYIVKFALAPNNSKQRLELKLQYSKQDSNQSYLGLSDIDFYNAPYQRYGLSALDNIKVNHKQIVLRYAYQATESLNMSIAAYNNTMNRNWFKTEGIDLNGSSEADSLSKTSWSSIINDINTGASRDGFSAEHLQAILAGDLDTPIGSIDMRANSRQYYSRGMQLGLNFNTQTKSIQHTIQLGLRFHRDQEDRLQYDSSYQQLNRQLILNSVGELGAAGNRIQQAQALSAYIYDELKIGKWLVSPGIRYENIKQERIRFDNGSNRITRDSRSNDEKIFLPGIGINFEFNEALSIIAGAYKGFTAPTNAPNVDSEEAINYEFGFRYNKDSSKIEVIGFLSDYKNLLGVCELASGANCEIGSAFNGDAVKVEGVELLAASLIQLKPNLTIPFKLAYTFTQGQFATDIAETAFFGDVKKGAPLPYLPKNQYLFSTGIERENWSFNFRLKSIDATCVSASCGIYDKTDKRLTIDLSTNFNVNETLALYARLENANNDSGIAGRHPYGARPNLPRTATFGIILNL